MMQRPYCWAELKSGVKRHVPCAKTTYRGLPVQKKMVNYRSPAKGKKRRSSSSRRKPCKPGHRRSRSTGRCRKSR